MGPLIPPGVVPVSESGIRVYDDTVRLIEAGFRAVLVGESLMRQQDRATCIRRLRGVTCG
jgi:indole-3-glycerol phosphate synthase